MSVDYQVMEYKDSAPIREVGLFSRTPITLDIVGSNFVDVSVVLINGARSPEFIVLSSSRVLAQMPSNMGKAAINSVVVFVASGRLLAKSAIMFQAVVSAGKRASGLQYLVQSFLKRLLTTPGSDIYRPSDGGGIQTLVGLVETEILAKAKASVAATASQMISYQSQSSRLGRSEKLQLAKLLSATFSPTTGTVDLRIQLTALDGSSASASLSV